MSRDPGRGQGSTLPTGQFSGLFFLAAAGATGIPLLAALGAYQVAALIAGPNVVHLGVGVHARGGEAILGGLLSYLVLTLAALLLAKRLAQPSNPLLVGAPSVLALLGLIGVLVVAHG